MAEICRMYGWDWDTYHDQPYHFIKTIVGRMKIDKAKADHEASKPQKK